ncbi:MAG: hypothetical protein V4629_03125 [Pseudomonadota bacterium]
MKNLDDPHLTAVFCDKDAVSIVSVNQSGELVHESVIDIDKLPAAIKTLGQVIAASITDHFVISYLINEKMTQLDTFTTSMLVGAATANIYAYHNTTAKLKNESDVLDHFACLNRKNAKIIADQSFSAKLATNQSALAALTALMRLEELSLKVVANA